METLTPMMQTEDRNSWDAEEDGKHKVKLQGIAN